MGYIWAWLHALKGPKTSMPYPLFLWAGSTTGTDAGGSVISAPTITLSDSNPITSLKQNDTITKLTVLSKGFYKKITDSFLFFIVNNTDIYYHQIDSSQFSVKKFIQPVYSTIDIKYQGPYEIYNLQFTSNSLIYTLNYTDKNLNTSITDNKQIADNIQMVQHCLNSIMSHTNLLLVNK